MSDEDRPSPRPDDGADVRLTQLALGAALGIAIAALGFVFWLRYGPPRVPVGTAAPASVVKGPAGGADELSVVTAAATPAESSMVRDSAEHVGSAGSQVPTDVVLLPCSEANPRPDGRILIPPHDPTHRTIVGLPSAAGEARRGLVIPPHDPSKENRITVQFVPLDSILETTVRVPAHDPGKYKFIRPDSLPCIEG